MSNMSRKINILVFCICVLINLNYAFNDCGSELGHFTNIKVTNCDQSARTRCNLKRGTNVSIEIDFTLNQNVNNVQAEVFGELESIKIPFPLSNPNACVDLLSGLHCPLKGGGNYSYKSSLLVKRIYPKLSVNVFWNLIDENKKVIVCVIIPAKIV